jgi:hypothetical protein
MYCDGMRVSASEALVTGRVLVFMAKGMGDRGEWINKEYLATVLFTAKPLLPEFVCRFEECIAFIKFNFINWHPFHFTAFFPFVFYKQESEHTSLFSICS